MRTLPTRPTCIFFCALRAVRALAAALAVGICQKKRTVDRCEFWLLDSSPLGRWSAAPMRAMETSKKDDAVYEREKRAGQGWNGTAERLALLATKMHRSTFFIRLCENAASCAGHPTLKHKCIHARVPHRTRTTTHSVAPLFVRNHDGWLLQTFLSDTQQGCQNATLPILLGLVPSMQLATWAAEGTRASRASNVECPPTVGDSIGTPKSTAKGRSTCLT